MALKHLRSSTADKRPQASGMADGQLAMNTASGSPGLFFKDAAGNVVKIGPVHVGSGAPNASPASGGTTGNSIGEQWLDNSGGTYVFKIWDGAAWRSESGEFVNASGDTMTGSLTMGPSATLIFEGSVDDGFETTLTVTNPTADRTIRLPNVTGTVVTTGDTGSVTSTMIASDTILNVDINSAAAIAGTKISPNFGGQNITTSGTFIHALASSGSPSITFSGDSNTGVYSPGPDNIAISNGGVTRFTITDSGFVRMGPGSTLAFPSITAGATVILDGVAPSVGSASLNGLAIVSRGGAGFGGQATERLVFHSVGWSSYSTISHTTNAGGNSLILDGATYIAMRASDRAVVAGINSAELEVNNATKLIAKASELVINDDANDYDFRVEGDTKANLFFVDASTDRIGINTSAPDDILHIHDTGGTTTLRLSQAAAAGPQDSNMIFFESENYNKTATISHTANSFANTLQIGGVTDLYFDGDQQFFRDTAGTVSLFIATDGQVAVGKLLTPNVPDLAFYGDTNTGVSSPGDDQLAIITAGVERVEWGTTEVVFNDGGVNYDFRIEGDTNANLFFVDASTDRVGVGTGLPDSTFNVQAGTNNTAAQEIASFSRPDAAVRAAISKGLIGGTTNGIAFGTTTNHPFALNTNGTERLYITNAGLVGIGTTNPGGALDIKAAASTAPLIVQGPSSEFARIDSSGRLLVGTPSGIAIGSFTPTLQNVGSSTQNSSIALSTFSTTDDVEPRLNFSKSATATIGVNALVASGESLGSIRFHGSQTAGYIQAATIECYVDGDPETAGDISDMPGRIVLKTTPDGGQTPVERVRITSAGRVGIGTTTTPDTLLHLSSATGSSSPTPTELRITTRSVASDWSTTDPWGRISFYSEDGSASGPKIHASIDATALTTGGGASDIVFRTNNNLSNTLEARMVIKGDPGASGARVGIGTTSPTYALEVASNDTTANIGYALRLRANATAGASALQFTNSTGSTQSALISVTDSTNASPRVLTFNALGGLVATLGTTEAARIDSSGRLLVGTSSPITVPDGQSYGVPRSPQFQIAGVGSSSVLSSIAFFNTSENSPEGAGCFSFSRSNTTTIGGHAIVSSGDVIGKIGYSASDDSEYLEAATITAVVDGTPGAYDMPGSLVFSTTADGAASPTERMRIDSNGFARHTGAIGRGAPVTKTGAFTVGIAENWLICNGTASITVTLPTASAWTGREIMLKTIAAFTVVSASSNVVPLAGGAAGTAILAATAGRFATLVSDGTNWIIMQAN